MSKIRGISVSHIWVDEAEDIIADERAALLDGSGEEEHDCAQDDDYH